MTNAEFYLMHAVQNLDPAKKKIKYSSMSFAVITLKNVIQNYTSKYQSRKKKKKYSFKQRVYVLGGFQL